MRKMEFAEGEMTCARSPIKQVTETGPNLRSQNH